MGLHRAFCALALLLLVTGLTSAQQQPMTDDADILPIDELTLQSTAAAAATAAPEPAAAAEAEDPCSIAGYGSFGVPDAAGAAASAGGYGAAAQPGGYGYGGAAAAAAATPAAELLRSKHCLPLTTPGRLLGVGGLADCKGSFTPLAPELSPLASAPATDAMGRFTASPATLGLYTWKADSSCVDRVTGTPLSYNWQLVAHPYDLLVVTDLSLLTLPASRGLQPLEQGSGEVFNRVYKAFGVDARQLQIDMITYENVTSASPVWPALMGLNAQLSFIAHAAAHTMLTIKQGPASQQLHHQHQLSEIEGIQAAIWNVVDGLAGGDGAGLLTSRRLIREVLSEVADHNSLPHWETSSIRGEEVLLDSIARIVAASNQDLLKPIVDTAMSCATSALAGMPRVAPECSAASMAASIASVATLQKTNVTADILALARAYVNTGNPLNTPSSLPAVDPTEDPDRAPAPSTDSSSSSSGDKSKSAAPVSSDGTVSVAVSPMAAANTAAEAEEHEEEWSPTRTKKHRVKISSAKARRQAVKNQLKCSKAYDPDICQHDLRPMCDYHAYQEGAFPPDSCNPYKTYAQSKVKALVRAAAAHMDGDSVDSLEPDGSSEAPKRRKGLLGLLALMGTALLGMLGVVGIIPAGGLLVNSLAPLPLGTIIILPGLVLAPLHAPLNAAQAKGIMPWSFGGNCGPFGGHLPLDKVQGSVPQDVLRIIPQNTCLPRGWLYKLPNMTEAGFSPKLSKLPASTIVLKNDTIYVPQQGGSTVKSLAKSIPGIDTTEWASPRDVAADSEGFKVVESEGRHYFIVEERLDSRARLASTNQADAPDQQQQQQQQQQRVAGAGLVHGSAECIKQGPPPASCPASGTLSPVGLLATKPGKAQPPTPLQGTAVAVGYVQGCAGDYYSYNELSAAAEEVQKLNQDRRFSSVFKSFTTGGGDEAAKEAWGSFGVGNVTGRGHAFLTNAWACPDKVPEDAPVCVDGWTGVQIKVPIGGLAPYPKDHKRDRGANVDVVLSPLGLATLVDAAAGGSNGTTVADAYAAAVERSGDVELSGNAMLADPVRLLKSGKTPLVKQGVALMVENAKVLNTLTTARALYECRSGSTNELSNELFVEWAGKLLQQPPMTKPGPLKAALRELCLEGSCSDNAAGALLMLNKYLGAIKAKYESLPKNASVPLSLVDDLVKLVQLSHVGQVELYDSVRSCCGLTGATSAGPLDDFVQRMEDLTAMASIQHSAIHAAAAVAMGGGVDVSTSSIPAGSDSSSSSSSGDRGADTLESASTSMVGTLLNSGGVRDCKGILYPQVQGEAPLALLTDGQGQFVVDTPVDGIYKFSSALAGSACVDTLTGVPVTFPMIQQLPASLSATVTAISLLMGPAKGDPAVRDVVSVNGQVSPELLANYVYGLFGLYADELDVDFFSFTGQALQLGSPRLAQVSGAIAQTMATYTAGHSMLMSLFGSKASRDQVAQCIVAATYKKIAHNRNAAVTLTDKTAIVAIYKDAYTHCAPPSRRRALLAADGEVPGSTPGDDAYAGIAAAFKAAHPEAAPGNSSSKSEDELWEQLAAAMDAGSASAPSKQPASEATVGIAAASPKAAAAKPKAAAAAAAAKAKAPAAATAADPASGEGGSEVDDLFDVAARILAVSNQKVQQLVVLADRAASTYKKGKAPFSISSVLANISSVAAVQQTDFAASVGNLASTVADDLEQGTSPDALNLQRGLFQAQVTDLEDGYTGDSLDNRIEAKAASITAAALAKGLGNVGQTLVVDDDGRVAVLVPGAEKPKAKVNPGVIAGAVIGGVFLLAALAGLTVWLVQRRRKAATAQGGPFSSGSGDGTGADAAPLEPPAIAGGRKLKLIGRRSNGTEDGEGSVAGSATPHSTAGPVAEAVLTPSNGGSSGSNAGGVAGHHGNVLLMNTNPLFGTPNSPRPESAGAGVQGGVAAGATTAANSGVRSSAGDLRNLQ